MNSKYIHFDSVFIVFGFESDHSLSEHFWEEAWQRYAFKDLGNIELDMISLALKSKNYKLAFSILFNK